MTQTDDADADLRTLFGQSTAVFASLHGPDHRLEVANAAFFAAIGRGAGTPPGTALGRLMPELAGQGFLGHLDHVFRTGETFVGRDARVLLGEGADAREAFFDFTYEPRRDGSGDILGVRVLGVETTQVKQAQRLAAEHRVLLEQIAREAPLEQVLDGMARAIEDLGPDVLVSVLLADADGRHLRHGAAPSLPAFYNEAIDGIAAGEGVGSCGTAAHRRSPVIVTDIGRDPFWADFRDLATRAGLAACWSTPILARDGRLLGTFAMYHRAPRSPQAADLALARLFTDTAALAIERHQIEQARQAAEAKEQVARNDLAFLLKASTVLADQLDHVQTLQGLADLLAPVVAPLCTVDIVEDGRWRRVACAADTPRHAELLAGAPVATVERVRVSGRTEIVPAPPGEADIWARLGVTAHLCVPLTERNQTFGTVTLFRTDGSAFDERAVSLAEEVARRGASAARNARQYQQRVTLARDLQAGLLMPDPPEIPGAGLATFYHPAGEGLEIGGDFYDVFPLDGNTWAFLLGDVCGRGPAAATTTALVRHTARAVAPLLRDPVAIVRTIDTALANRPHAHGSDFVTLLHGHLTPTAAGLEITLVRAGHNHPLLLDDTHHVHELHIPGCLLGMVADPRLEARRFLLKPGESLIMLTDGILEARNAGREEFGERRLAEAVAAAPERPDAWAVLTAITDAVSAFAQPGAAPDDQAVLVLTAAGADRSPVRTARPFRG